MFWTSKHGTNKRDFLPNFKQVGFQYMMPSKKNVTIIFFKNRNYQISLYQILFARAKVPIVFLLVETRQI